MHEINEANRLSLTHTVSKPKPVDKIQSAWTKRHLSADRNAAEWLRNEPLDGFWIRWCCRIIDRIVVACFRLQTTLIFQRSCTTIAKESEIIILFTDPPVFSSRPTMLHFWYHRQIFVVNPAPSCSLPISTSTDWCRHSGTWTILAVLQRFPAVPIKTFW